LGDRGIESSGFTFGRSGSWSRILPRAIAQRGEQGNWKTSACPPREAKGSQLGNSREIGLEEKAGRNLLTDVLEEK